MKNNTPSKIMDEVKAALEKEMQLSALDINVDMKDNVLMLTGVVDTLAEKAFAQKVANQISGVQKVENYITISTDGTLTDNEITAHVEKHLREGQQADRLEGVGVKVEGGSAVLMGRVETLSDKTNAVKAAQKAAGVKDVVSNIKFEHINDLPPTDEDIKNKIVTRLATSGLSVPDIDITSKDGNVVLKGYVEDNHMMELAEEITMQISGVKKLSNLLRTREKNDY